MVKDSSKTERDRPFNSVKKNVDSRKKSTGTAKPVKKTTKKRKKPTPVEKQYHSEVLKD